MSNATCWHEDGTLSRGSTHNDLGLLSSLLDIPYICKHLTKLRLGQLLRPFECREDIRLVLCYQIDVLFLRPPASMDQKVAETVNGIV